MARPLRIEFPGALYHVTSRGDRQEAIFEDDEDRLVFLHTLAEVVGRFNWLCHAYCLMTNHYHLLVETPDGNLSKGMRHLNGVYTQATNRRHARSGHLFQGRFKGILVDKDSYLLELTRYVVLNPVRVGMVRQPGKWQWSSYRAMIGDTPAPTWLATDGILTQFAKRRSIAQRRYREFVQQGTKSEPIWSGLQQQIYLGDEKFVKRIQRKAGIHGDELSIPRTQRRAPAPTLAKIAAKHHDRNAAIAAAYSTGAYSYREIAEYYGLHLATVGRIIRGQM
ncbi:MAG: transposase [Gammaproteobacteria bacterium]|nr:transposase [Gammaproteobacteria bacterium]